jgi:integrase
MDRVEKPKTKRSAPRYWIEKNGKVYARLQYTDDTGAKREKYKPITDKRTARSEVEKMRRELERHGSETLRSDKMTFAELAENYESTKLVQAVYVDGVKVAGKRSIKPVQTAVNVLKDYFGNKHIRAIKTSDLENYKNHRLKTPIEIEVNQKTKVKDEKTGKTKTVIKKVKQTSQRKVSSVNRELETLRAMFNFAIENDWLIKNPFVKKKGIISKASENERDRTLSSEEENRLLSVCIDQRAHIKPLVICALDTGMRRGEMFQMRWRDVNLETNEIFIPQTNTKTDAERIVGITARLHEELEKLWESSPKDKDGLVFGITNTIKTAWKTACDKADIKNFRLHDCRHTATTRMIASGSAHTEVMKITGHTQLKTFLRYLNITNETAKRCAARLDDYLMQIASQNVESNLIN